jgi:hypothetical protein
MTTVLMSLHRGKFTVHSRRKADAVDLVISPDGERGTEIVLSIPDSDAAEFFDRTERALRDWLPCPRPEDFPGGADCQDPPEPTMGPTEYVLHKALPFFDKRGRL